MPRGTGLAAPEARGVNGSYCNWAVLYGFDTARKPQIHSTNVICVLTILGSWASVTVTYRIGCIGSARLYIG